MSHQAPIPLNERPMKLRIRITTLRFIVLLMISCGIYFASESLTFKNAFSDENRAEDIVKKIIGSEKIQQQELKAKPVPPFPGEPAIQKKESTPAEKKPQPQEKNTPQVPIPKKDAPSPGEMPSKKKSETTMPSIQDEGDRAGIAPGGEKSVITKDRKKKADSKGQASADEALYKSGIDFFNANLFEASIKSFEELKTKHRDSPRLHSALIYSGKAYMRIGNFSKASEELSSVPNESGEYPASLYHLAESQIGMGKKDEAIATLYRLATQYPQTSLADDALVHLSQIFLQEKKGHQALESAVKIIRHYSDRETVDDAYFMIGQIYEKDPVLRDVEVSRKIYRIFLQKAHDGDNHFTDSPLLRRVKRELKSLEKRYFRHER